MDALEVARDTPAPLHPTLSRRAVIAASIGNGLEFYDFVTFAFFAIQIGNTFFPSADRFTSLMGSLATFAAGFAARPMGALVIGRIGDRVGRKPAMLLSFSLMGLGIALLCLTPGYARIGIAAPIVAVVARLIQGFALGGDIGAATTYMVEASPPELRGRAVSWQGVSQNVGASAGALFGGLLTLVLSDAQMTDFGWRLALAVGLLIVPFGLYIRRSLPETHDLPDDVMSQDAEGKSYARPLTLAFILITSATIGTYITNYMATYGQNELGLSGTVSLMAEFGSNAISAFALLWGGIMADRFGRRPWLIWPYLISAALIVPLFWWITTERNGTSFILANLILAVPMSVSGAALYCAIIESVPKAARVRAFALTYSLAVALFGGTTQMVVTWLLRFTGNPMSIAWYCAAIQLIGGVVAMGARETAPRVLATRGTTPMLAT